MDWVNELCTLYDINKDKAGVMEYKTIKTKKGEEHIPIVLLPVSHTTVAAQITVTIDPYGNFLRAQTVEHDDKLTIIPVTAESASRTSGKEPHPFCDNLKYLAGDYSIYIGDGKNYSEYHQLYMEALARWHNSPDSHEKVNALYWYLEKDSLIQDLTAAGILEMDENGYILGTKKIQNIKQADAFVRFRVESVQQAMDYTLSDINNEYCPECWLDRSLQRCFIAYYESSLSEKDICYLTGEETAISFLHPKKIRNEGDGTKLISANDAQNFTYRGRFATREEALSIGYVASQKLHNALKWIIRKQGCQWDDLCVVTWESNLLPLPGLYEDTDTLCDGYESEGWQDEEEEQEDRRDTNEQEANRFRSAMKGYIRHLEPDSRMVLLALDAGTPGRLSLANSVVLESSQYIAHIQHWHEGCLWLQTKYKDGNRHTFMGMQGVREIAENLYGTEQNGMLSLNGRAKMYAEVCKRILPCIYGKRPIPDDLVNRAIERASSPVSYEKRYNWERVFTMACSFVKKQRLDKFIDKKEERTVSLDLSCPDRSYLYGRLLAVADRVEYRTFSKEDEKRQTNAKRYMKAFSQKPYQTWQLLEEKLEPYLVRLSKEERIKYNSELNEICELFKPDEYKNNTRLNGMYLLGFHNQSYAMIRPKTKEEQEVEKL